MDKRIGLIITFNLSSGGGASRVAVDLINSLNVLNYKVYLLTPFKLNYPLLRELYGPFKVSKIYYPSKLKRFFCRESMLARKILKKEFKKLANNVNKIIDIDGGILHDYLPKSFDKSNYIIWRISGVGPEDYSWENKSFKRKVKNLIKEKLKLKQTEKRHFLKRGYKIYAVDDWTRKKLIKYWKLSPESICLYPEIKTDDFLYKEEQKKDQIIILGRISPNKNIEDSIKIFFKGTEEFKSYNLVILGGITNESESYIKFLRKVIHEKGDLKRVKIIKQPSFENLKEVVLDSKVIIDSQRNISLTMTSIESMAAGNIVLAHKTGGTYLEVLNNGEYGYGFENIEEGGEKLGEIIKKLENKELDQKRSIQRADFFSKENFIKRLKQILEEDGI